MSDTLVTIIGIFLAAVIMFVFPLMTVSNTQDNIAQVSVQSLVAEFVNNVAIKGKITQDDYNTFISKLYATGNTYEVQLEHKKMSTNPNKGADDQLGENLYYSVYNSVIIDSEETGINYNNEYLMKKGDYIIVTVKNTNTTMASQIKNFMYSIVEKDIYRIAANASALVINTGGNKVNSNVSDDIGNSEQGPNVSNNVVVPDPDILFPETNEEKYFDGSRGHVISLSGENGGVTANGKTSMIINATFKFDESTTPLAVEQTIVSTTQKSGYSFVIQKKDEEDRLLLGVWNTSKQAYDVFWTDVALEDNVTYNATAICNKEEVIIYIYNKDGISKKSFIKPSDFALNQDSTLPTVIGANPYKNTGRYDAGCFFKGYIYNVKIWFNKEFTKEQITKIIQDATEGIF